MNADLRFYLTQFRRRLPLFGAVIAVVTGLAVAVALLLPPVYRAEAVLLVESAQIPGDLAVPTVRTAASEQLQIIEQRMLTRANMLDTARRFRLYEGQAMDPTRIVEDMRRRTRMEVSQGANMATIVRIAFDADTPETAAEVANALVSFTLEENVALRTSIAGQTLDFFRREVQRLSEELEARSGRILAFKLENRDALPEDLPMLRERQAELAERINAKDDEIRQLAAQREAFIARYERTGRIDVVVEDSFAPFIARLADLKDELERTVSTLGANSERAVGLRARLAALERSLDAQLVAEGVAPGGQEAVFAHHRDRIDARLAEIAEERAVLEARAEEIGALVRQTLTNAIALDTLEGDYASTREQHARALASVSAAETGDLIETLAKGQRIAVIEQAVAPPRPASPNRRLIVAGGFAAALALVAGMMVLMERLNQTIRRPADLQRALGIAAFASIPQIETPGAAGLRRAGHAGLWLAVLGGVPALLYAVHVFYLPLDLLGRQMLDAIGIGPLLDSLRPAR